MTTPRIEIDLCKIRQNTRFLVDHLASHGISVTGVTKAVCGDPAVAHAMLESGVSQLADARVANVKRMRCAGIICPISMIRSPMLSEIDQIIETCETSYNTEIDVIAELSAAALFKGEVHGVILMIEMGDMRDGIMPEDLERIATMVMKMPGVALKGIGANFACLGNIAPNADAMEVVTTLAYEIEGACGPFLETVSGGSSANLPWALDLPTKGRINELRLGEAILLGTDPVSGEQIDGLHTDAFTLVVEVIETKFKTRPFPLRLIDPALLALRLVQDSSSKSRSVLAVGLQDTNVGGLSFPTDITFVGATSDHTVTETSKCALQVGAEIRCQLNYGALMRAMNATDVEKVFVSETTWNGAVIEPDRVHPTVI
ncbi:alanine/ornithine racemase family PLP-dependent enzyme [Ruegeria sp. A3M17]|uniref:alanine/ornithine racemase family PLP-dependent enzyme n=1 Tax=Ruegeria sp. A3M17 TaxID=2267229 RepID=UPI000DE8162D|nr:alanine/ornithine racemase family PLP-dependent enzyme [Ruegeria sp. A3M17]RBW63264.1 alanine/ornithine racemase family PLP-dependent enzyme [Ruegeria sp. A3M17]